MSFVKLLAHEAGTHALVGVAHVVSCSLVLTLDRYAMILNVEVLLQSSRSCIHPRAFVVCVVYLDIGLFLDICWLLHGACSCIGWHILLVFLPLATFNQ